jgi:glycosyltransferase involved in cell wall biosynthesis
MNVLVVIASIGKQSLLGSILSLNEQTDKNFSILIVDDSPNELPFKKEITEWFPNLTILRGPRKGWAGPPRNMGIAYAQEMLRKKEEEQGKDLSNSSPQNVDWIAFLDDDDFFHPRYIEWLKSYATLTPHADVVVFRARGKFDHIPQDFAIPPANCYSLIAGLVTNSFAIRVKECVLYDTGSEQEMAAAYTNKQTKGPGEDIKYLYHALSSKKHVLFSQYLAYGVQIQLLDTETQKYPLVQLTL